RSRAGTDNIFDFNTWSPRLGMTYALTEEQKTILRVGLGRYYDPISLENLRRFGPDMEPAQTFVLHYSVPFDIADANHDGEISSDESENAARYLHDLQPESIDDLGFTDSSWQLQVRPGTKDTYTDQITMSVGRELRSNFSVEASYVYKLTSGIMVGWPVNRETGEDFPWVKVPYTTQDGRTFDVWSIDPAQDYNHDGTTDIEDARWVTQNVGSEVRNLDRWDGKKAERRYQGAQIAFEKRQSNGWQLQGSFLYSHGTGVAPRTTDQNWYIEGPMIMDTPFVQSPNQLVNNMSGPLPMLPKYSLKLAGSYTIPHVLVDLGGRLRYNTGRPFWPVEVVPQFEAWM